VKMTAVEGIFQGIRKDNDLSVRIAGTLCQSWMRTPRSMRFGFRVLTTMARVFFAYWLRNGHPETPGTVFAWIACSARRRLVGPPAGVSERGNHGITRWSGQHAGLELVGRIADLS
jgi:hypothetical protein